MPSPDTLATIAAVFIMAAAVLSMRLIRPIGSDRPRHGAAWLDAHAVPVEARHYRAPVEDAPVEAPRKAADDTSPWTVPAVLATIPDTLTIVRAA